MSTNTLARNGQQAIAITTGPAYEWSAEDVALIRQSVAAKANDTEFKLLLYMAHKYGLDPLVKQIYCVKYGSKPAQIFAGRDGFLAIAHRSGAFDGMQTTLRIEQVPFSVEYTYYENDQRKTGTFKRAWQYVATTTVWRKGAAHPFVVEVWEEEYTSGRDLWTSKPRTMIAKVGECQTLRRAFDISGLYDPDEIRTDVIDTSSVEVRDVPEPTQQQPPTVNPATGEVIDVTPAAFDPALPTEEERAAVLGRISPLYRPLGMANTDELKAAILKRTGHKMLKDVPYDVLVLEAEYWERAAADVHEA